MMGDAVTYRLVLWTPIERSRLEAGLESLCPWTSRFTLTVPLPTLVHK